MLRVVIGSLLALIFTLSPAFAECVDVIRASALRGTVVEDANSIEQEARAFCREYASSKGRNGSTSVSGIYNAIGISVGQSSSHIEEVARKYCNAGSQFQSRANSYERYVESIAPGAFGAYHDCIEAGRNWINASLPVNAIQARDLTIIVGNRTDGHNQEQVRFVASPGFSCRWTYGAGWFQRDLITLGANESSSLQCTRRSEAIQGSITISTQSRPNANYTFLWRKFQNGLPVDELEAIRGSNTALLKSMTSAVVAFDSDTCPSGWQAIPALSGRTIVGSGAGNGLTPRIRGTAGGEEMHQLSVEEMPTHTHKYIFTDHRNTPEHTDFSANEFGTSNTPKDTEPSGGSQAHNNMQPFYVLQYCKRSQ